MLQCHTGYRAENLYVSTASITCLESGDWSSPDEAFICLKGINMFEPPREKTNTVTVRPAKTQISLGTQADLSLRWAHTHFVGFVMRWLILSSFLIFFIPISIQRH